MLVRGAGGCARGNTLCAEDASSISYNNCTKPAFGIRDLQTVLVGLKMSAKAKRRRCRLSTGKRELGIKDWANNKSDIDTSRNYICGNKNFFFLMDVVIKGGHDF